MEIDLALARFCHAAGLVVLDEDGADGNAFIGKLPADPDEAIAFKSTGGVGLDDQTSGYAEPTVQIVARGGPHDRRGPLNKLLDIYNALAGLGGVTLDPGGSEEVYAVRISALQSYPADWGQDENERWTFSQNWALHVRHQTANTN